MSKSEISKYDRWSLAVSTFALVVSIVSPIVNFRYFQNTVREQTLKSRALQVIGARGIIIDQPIENKDMVAYWIYIENVGELSVKEVQIVVRNQEKIFEDANHPIPFLDPPVPFDVIKSSPGSSYTIVLRHPIPPGAKLGVRVFQSIVDKDIVGSPPEPRAWVQSEASQIPVPWSIGGAGW